MTIEERVDFLMQSTESHDRQIGELTGHIGELTGQVRDIKDSISALRDSITKLVHVTNEDATAIRTLARLAEAHERRISDIERRDQ